MLIADIGRRGHAVGDIPGVRFKVSVLQAPSHPIAALLKMSAVWICTFADPGSSSMHAQVISALHMRGRWN